MLLIMVIVVIPLNIMPMAIMATENKNENNDNMNDNNIENDISNDKIILSIVWCQLYSMRFLATHTVSPVSQRYFP